MLVGASRTRILLRLIMCKTGGSLCKIVAISRSSQCSTTGVTKAVVCVILSVGWCI